MLIQRNIVRTLGQEVEPLLLLTKLLTHQHVPVKPSASSGGYGFNPLWTPVMQINLSCLILCTCNHVGHVTLLLFPMLTRSGRRKGQLL